MSVMRWFRKNNKKLLVGIVFVLMLAFGLPNIPYWGQRDQGDEIVVTYRPTAGKLAELTGRDYSQARTEIDALTRLRLNDIQVNMLPGLQDVGMPAILSTHMLLLGEDPRMVHIRRVVRQQWQDQIATGDWPQADAVREQLLAAVNSMTGAQPGNVPVYYLVLAEEARQAGIRPANAEVEAFLTQLRQAFGISMGDLVKMSGMPTQTRLAAAVRNYMAIIRYADSIGRVLNVSENELKRALRHSIEREYVKGEYVQFPASAYMAAQQEPNLDDLQTFFEKYKTCHQDEVTDDNPFGLGYRLEDRVQAEYLQVSLADARAVVEADLAAMDLLDQEARIEQEWQEDRPQYLERLKQQRERQQGAEEPRQWTPEELKDLERQARLQWERGEVWQQRLARERAEQVLRSALEAARRQEVQAEPGAQPVDLSRLAERFSTEAVPVIYGRTPHLGQESMQSYKGWGRAYPQAGPGGRASSLPETLFAAAPLRDRPADRLEERATEMYELVGPVVAQSWAGGDVFLVRIVAVDKARVPNSLADDGRAGPQEDTDQPIENSELFRQVEQDWKRMGAYELARQRAQAFVQQVRQTGWEQAIDDHNAQVKDWDPNSPEAQPIMLQAQTLDSQHDRLEQMEQMAMQSGTNEWAQQQMDQIMSLLSRAADLANSGEELPATVERQEQFAIIVFGEAQTIVPGTQDYVRRRPLIVQELSAQSRMWAMVLHFSPEQIEQRTGLNWTPEAHEDASE